VVLGFDLGADLAAPLGLPLIYVGKPALGHHQCGRVFDVALAGAKSPALGSLLAAGFPGLLNRTLHSRLKADVE
jgi:hypothetical protein